jgi:hypothetical protein
VFDLFGHICRVSSTGEEAACLTEDSGVAINFHPGISPDGAIRVVRVVCGLMQVLSVLSVACTDVISGV